MDASEHKWVNPNNIWYGVNSLRLGGLHINVMYFIDMNLIRLAIKILIHIGCKTSWFMFQGKRKWIYDH